MLSAPASPTSAYRPPAPGSLLAQMRRELGQTLLLALPIMAGQLSQMLMGLADSLMVGRVGVTPLASSAFTSGVLNAPILFCIGVTGAVSVLCAQAHGAGQVREAGEVVRHGFLIAAVTGALMTGIIYLWVFAGGLYRIGQPPQVAAGARDFLLLITASLVPVLFWQVLKQFCEALSRPWVPMFIALGAVALNAAINWALIYGKLGFPAMGLAGAGVGTLIARMAMVMGLAAFILRVPALRAALPETWRAWVAPFSAQRLRALLALGLPVALQLVLEVGAFGMATLMMGWMGTRALAAHQIAINCAATTFMLPLGLGMAVSVRIGQAVGANAGRRALRLIGFSGVGLAAAMMAACALMFLIFRREIALLFVQDATAVALTAQLLIVAGIFQVADGVQIVSMQALRGLSDVKVPTYISLTAYWLLALPVCYIVGFYWNQGPRGVWTGLAAGIGFSAVFLTGRFWKKT